MPTERAKRLPAKIVANRGHLGKAMKDAGYSDAYATNPHQAMATDGYKEAAKPFLDKLEAERNRILEAMSIKDLDKVHYNHLSEALVRTTHDLQLLGGKPTEIIKDDELDDELERIRARRRAIESARAGAGNKEGEAQTS